MRFFLFLLSISCLCFAQRTTDERVDARKAFFKRHGYLWLKNFYSPEQVKLLQEFANRIDQDSQKLIELSECSGLSLQRLAKEIPGSLIVVPESKNPKKACRAEDFLSVYPDLHRLVTGTITSFIGSIFNEPFTVFKDKINFKWPGGGAFSPHQDFPAYEFLGPKEHITAMICIDEASFQNGCLYIAEDWLASFEEDDSLDMGALQEGRAILPYNIGGKDHGSIQSRYVEKITWLPVLAKPGDVVLFNSYVPHYSESNESNTSRRAMFITHNRFIDGDFRGAYFYTKRNDPDHPMFHFATPTKARTKE